MQGLLGMTIQGEFGSRFCAFILFHTLPLSFDLRFHLLQFSWHLLSPLKNFTKKVDTWVCLFQGKKLHSLECYSLE